MNNSHLYGEFLLKIVFPLASSMDNNLLLSTVEKKRVVKSRKRRVVDQW